MTANPTRAHDHPGTARLPQLGGMLGTAGQRLVRRAVPAQRRAKHEDHISSTWLIDGSRVVNDRGKHSTGAEPTHKNDERNPPKPPKAFHGSRSRRFPCGRPMISEAGRRRLALESVAGLVVSRTKVVAVVGSCQAMVPVDPKCPNVSAEHVRPNAPGSRCQPRPKRGRSVPVWIARISRRVAADNTSPSGNTKASRNAAEIARSGMSAAPWGAEVPPVRAVPVPIAAFGVRHLALGGIRDRSIAQPQRRLPHPQRCEHRPRHESRHRLAADLLDDRRSQQDAHALVADPRPGSEQQWRPTGSSHELRQGCVLEREARCCPGACRAGPRCA